jgi:hypothetical protein
LVIVLSRKPSFIYGNISKHLLRGNFFYLGCLLAEKEEPGVGYRISAQILPLDGFLSERTGFQWTGAEV